ncbi:MmgE/PrpD family protein [Henriciella litoralis]|uniref:MmgE/PrpD family protein n=1 Tax=Henriciella litoralis TaxID=568102 RepID=UPI0009FB9D3D|nr:MmgE/PrpD family protein [Henriciella litoralis]
MSQNPMNPNFSRRGTLGLGLFGLGAALAGAPKAMAEGGAETSEATETAADVPANITPTISKYIAEIRTADVEPEFLELAKRHILDSIASAVSCKDLEPAMLGRKYALMKSEGAANGATMLGTKERVGLVDAAFGSAMIVHGSEINDFIPSAFVQPGPAVVGTAFAIAENRGLSGHDVLRSCVAGYELCGRMPKALGVRNLYRMGIANHSLGPCFGAAATAASLLGLPSEKVQHVMSYAVQQASGSWQWLLDEEHIEKTFVFAGVGARNGIEAALLVETGLTGVADCFDNEAAYMHHKMFAGGDHDPAYLIEDLATRSELTHTAYKRYPVGGPTQPAVQAVLELLPKTSPETVESIVMEMPGRWDAFRNAEMPALNLRYLASIILIDGRLDLVSAQDRDRFNNDAKVRALMEKMDVIHAPDLEVKEGETRTEPARVTLVDGKTGETKLFVPWVRGFPSHPMTRQDVLDKAMELLWPVVGKPRAKDVIDTVMDIENVPKADTIVQLIAS